MCGLAAVFTPGRPAEPELVAQLGARVAHRGPDGSAVASAGPVALYHARLAILDLATGAQPMRDEALSITYNGEIYNYRELRNELEGRGHRFRTASDTEVILKAYREWGGDAFARLNGMFALVLVDEAKGELVAARDRIGIKPLYWTRSGGRLAWASEIKALLALPDVERAADPDAIEDYLTFQFVLGERTLFRGIHKVAPGTYQRVSLADGRLQVRTYWSLAYEVDMALQESVATERLRALLDDAVRIQLRSDVPVGSHLSGGLDSSVIAGLAAPLLPGFAAFAGVFREGPEFDESPFARDVATTHGLVLHEIVPDVQDLSSLLPRLVWHLDEPAAGPGVIPQFAVSAYAARHVKVTLGGQGGDEVFGGYTRYLVAYLEQALKGAIHETNEEAEHIVSLRSILPNLPTLQRYTPMLQQFWRSGVFEPMDRRYFRLLDRLGGATSVLDDEWRSAHPPERAFERFAERFNRPDTRSYFNKMTHFDLTASLPALLQVEDRASMASGLESRVPLLDHRIIEFMATLPPRLKFRGGELKYLLKRAAGDVVPPAVLARKDKMGFPVPFHLWTRGSSRDYVHDLLLSSRTRERGIYDVAGVSQLLQHEREFSRQSWGMLNLEIWFRTFIDR